MATAMTWGSSAGAKPIKEDMYLPLPLGRVWLVAVLPPIRKPSTLPLAPLPSYTTISRISRIVAEVPSDTILPVAG